MCGVAGFICRKELDSADFSFKAVRAMSEAMASRGRDGFGYWSSPERAVTLGHRRLSILDLSSHANQPMDIGDSSYVIVFNGEIYNFRELRRELEASGDVFRTNSDTEVLLRLYRRDHEGMLSKLSGMFALAIWDQRNRSLFLARDPYGIKPLYIARCNEGWLFASQVKAILASGLIDTAPDLVGQAGFWLYGSVPEPHTWFQNIRSLPAGTWCKITSDGHASDPRRYWDIADAWREAPICRDSASDVLEVVRTAVRESVQRHLVSDVPVGVFLSGGIDSGSLAGVMKDCGPESIQGVTIAFDEFKGKHEDEAPAAAAIAKQFGIQHHVRTVTRQEFESDLPKILSSMDQPSIDGINTWYASKAVAELGLKVVISGVGGDELFYGYPSFKQLPKLVARWNMLSSIVGMRALADRCFAQMARRSGNARWRWMTRYAGDLYGAYWLRRGLFAPDELGGLMGRELDVADLSEFSPELLLEGQTGDLAIDPMAAVGQIESMTYLRNQLLRDSDWASMAHGVELRTPLVDATLLNDLKPVLRSFGRLKGKALLASSPQQPLSDDIVHRVKTGFGIPLGAWKRGSVSAEVHSHRQTSTQGGGDSRWWAQKVAKAVYSV